MILTNRKINASKTCIKMDLKEHYVGFVTSSGKAADCNQLNTTFLSMPSGNVIMRNTPLDLVCATWQNNNS